MKQYFSIVLALLCIFLIVTLVVIKRGDNTQHDTDTGTIADFSNRLDSAQTDLEIANGKILLFSNNLGQALSESLALSNQLDDAQAAIVLGSEQITNLTQQVAEMKAQNETLQSTSDQHALELTNLAAEIAGLTNQIASCQASLAAANKNYSLLEDRLRTDVAERVVVERQFNNLYELKSQIQYLEENPAPQVSAQDIYAGLDIEVNSNGSFHVMTPE